MDELENLDTWHESEIICPYCKTIQSDAWEYPDEDDDVECDYHAERKASPLRARM